MAFEYFQYGAWFLNIPGRKQNGVMRGYHCILCTEGNGNEHEEKVYEEFMSICNNYGNHFMGDLEGVSGAGKVIRGAKGHHG